MKKYFIKKQLKRIKSSIIINKNIRKYLAYKKLCKLRKIRMNEFLKKQKINELNEKKNEKNDKINTKELIKTLEISMFLSLNEFNSMMLKGTNEIIHWLIKNHLLSNDYNNNSNNSLNDILNDKSKDSMNKTTTNGFGLSLGKSLNEVINGVDKLYAKLNINETNQSNETIDSNHLNDSNEINQTKQITQTQSNQFNQKNQSNHLNERKRIDNMTSIDKLTDNNNDISIKLSSIDTTNDKFNQSMNNIPQFEWNQSIQFNNEAILTINQISNKHTELNILYNNNSNDLNDNLMSKSLIRISFKPNESESFDSLNINPQNNETNKENQTNESNQLNERNNHTNKHSKQSNNQSNHTNIETNNHSNQRNHTNNQSNNEINHSKQSNNHSNNQTNNHSNNHSNNVSNNPSSQHILANAIIEIGYLSINDINTKTNHLFIKNHSIHRNTSENNEIFIDNENNNEIDENIDILINNYTLNRSKSHSIIDTINQSINQRPLSHFNRPNTAKIRIVYETEPQIVAPVMKKAPSIILIKKLSIKSIITDSDSEFEIDYIFAANIIQVCLSLH